MLVVWVFAALLSLLPIFVSWKLVCCHFFHSLPHSTPSQVSAFRDASVSEDRIFGALRLIQKFTTHESQSHVLLVSLFALYGVFYIRSIFSICYFETLLCGFCLLLPFVVFSRFNGKGLLMRKDWEKKLLWKNLVRKGTAAYSKRYEPSSEVVDSVLPQEWQGSAELRRIIGKTLAPFDSFDGEIALSKLRICAYSGLFLSFFTFALWGGPIQFLIWILKRIVFGFFLRWVIVAILLWTVNWQFIPTILRHLYDLRDRQWEQETENRQDRVVLVTGGSKGIGKALARLACQEGFGRVVLVARTEDRLLETREEFLAEEGGAVMVDIVVADLCCPEGLEKVYAAVDRVDVLVNNAGIGGMGPFKDMDMGRLEKIVNLNILGVAALTRHYLPGMIEREYGRILVVSSIAGSVPSVNSAVYSSSKVFVDRLIQILRFETRNEKNIHVSGLAPGFTRTEIAQEKIEEELGVAVSPKRLLDAWDGLSVPVEEPEDVAKEGFRGLFQNIRKVLTGGPVNSIIATMLPAWIVLPLGAKSNAAFLNEFKEMIESWKEEEGAKKSGVADGEGEEEDLVVRRKKRVEVDD